MKSDRPSTIYGCLRLTGCQNLDLSFLGMDKLERGNHVSSFDSSQDKPFDYWHGGINPECLKQIVTARNTVFCSFKTKTDWTDNPATRLTHSILSMRQDLDTDLAGSSFLDKVFFHIFPKLDGRLCLSLDVSSALSQFVLIARDTSIYLTSFGDARSQYLIWSNECFLESRLRSVFGDQRFFYYRHVPLTNGVMVIQSQFLASKFAKWHNKLSDLVTLNALDVFLQRKTRCVPQEEL